VVLAAAGSTEPRARAEVLAAATTIGARVGYVGTAEPTLADLVTPDTAVASWFLAPGLFHRRAAATRATVVAAPVGAHPDVAALVVRRYRDATVRKQWVA
jgi:sirohydrochlorin ferrochelatase